MADKTINVTGGTDKVVQKEVTVVTPTTKETTTTTVIEPSPSVAVGPVNITNPTMTIIVSGVIIAVCAWMVYRRYMRKHKKK